MLNEECHIQSYTLRFLKITYQGGYILVIHVFQIANFQPYTLQILGLFTNHVDKQWPYFASPSLSGQMTLPHPLWMSILRYENIAKNPHTYLCLTFLLMKKQKQANKSQASSYEKENPKPSKCLTTWANLLGQFPSNRIHVPAMFLGEGDLLSVTWLVANKVNKVQWIVPPEFKYC